MYDVFNKIKSQKTKQIIGVIIILRFGLLLLISVKYGIKNNCYPVCIPQSQEKIMQLNENEGYNNIYKIWKNYKYGR